MAACALSTVAASVNADELSSQLAKELSGLAVSFSKLQTYRCQASLELATPAEFLDLLKLPDGPARASAAAGGLYEVKVLANQQKCMVERHDLSRDGLPPISSLFYVNGRSLATKSITDQITAVVDRLANDNVENLPRYVDSVLLPYAFLNYGAQGKVQGLPLLLLGAAASAGNWESLLNSLTKVESIEGGLYAEFVQGQKRLAVEFKWDHDRRFYPARVRLFAAEHIICEVSVNQLRGSFLGIAIPGDVTLETYVVAEPGSIHAATWKYRVTDAVFNEPIDEHDMTFDPSSVGNIWDEANKVSIVVPR